MRGQKPVGEKTSGRLECGGYEVSKDHLTLILEIFDKILKV